MSDKYTSQGTPASDPDWLSAALAGIISVIVVGAIVWIGFNPDIITVSIPSPFGISGALAGWTLLVVIGLVVGLAYATLNTISVISAWASTARTGTITGLIFGILLWVLAILVVPFLVGDGIESIGDYAVSVEGFLGYALLGVLIGFLYLLIPIIRAR